MKTQCRNGLKGQRANSPGQRPGYRDAVKFALKGQKPTCAALLLLPLFLEEFLLE